MTGYGSVNAQGPGFDVHVEIKTLNSKFLDLVMRIPKELGEIEAEIRNLITERLVRGKVMLTVELTRSADAEPTQQYNEALFEKYYEILRSMADRVGADTHDLFKLALESPDVVVTQPQGSLDEASSGAILDALDAAVSACEKFRENEGERLRQALTTYVQSIRDNLNTITEIDPTRVAKIDERLRGNIAKLIEEEHIDENRLEQELIFYIEKLDITEEKVRLASHLDFFLESMDQPTSSGKKLGFISQEMGREINTIGSKANDAEIQKYVVQMKEELEKIKEQLLNIV